MNAVGGGDISPTSTTIVFPPSMVRLLAEAHEEIGGLLSFAKKPFTSGGQSYMVMSLERADIIAGGELSVDGFEVLRSHPEDSQWCSFHSHPIGPESQYMGLSGGDLFFILYTNLTSPNPKPTVTHLLLTPRDVHMTVLNPVVYEQIRQILITYATYRSGQGVEGGTALVEFLMGMRYILALSELWVNNQGELWQSRGASIPWTDTAGLTILDSIWFTPSDSVTVAMLLDLKSVDTSGFPGASSYTLVPEGKPFIDWFEEQSTNYYNNIEGFDPTPENILALALEDIKEVSEQGFSSTGKGLYNTFSLPLSSFIVPYQRSSDSLAVPYGVLSCNDGGYIYNDYVEPKSTNIIGKNASFIDYVAEGFQASIEASSGGSRKTTAFTNNKMARMGGSPFIKPNSSTTRSSLPIITKTIGGGTEESTHYVKAKPITSGIKLTTAPPKLELNQPLKGGGQSENVQGLISEIDSRMHMEQEEKKKQFEDFSMKDVGEGGSRYKHAVLKKNPKTYRKRKIHKTRKSKPIKYAY